MRPLGGILEVVWQKYTDTKNNERKYKHTSTIQKYRNVVDKMKGVGCVGPLAGILGAVWKICKYKE